MGLSACSIAAAHHRAPASRSLTASRAKQTNFKQLTHEIHIEGFPRCDDRSRIQRPSEVSVTPAFFWPSFTRIYIDYFFLRLPAPLTDLIPTSVPVSFDQRRNNSDESLELSKLDL